jgi:hypothetical protein
MGTPAAGPSVTEVKISADADGTPVCTPFEITVRRGGSIRWTGVKHTGKFAGRILGAKQKGFTKADLKGLKTDPAEKPFAPVEWPDVTDVTVQVKQNAKAGAYKYDIIINGVKLDPVVIIEDDGGDPPPQ